MRFLWAFLLFWWSFKTGKVCNVFFLEFLTSWLFQVQLHQPPLILLFNDVIKIPNELLSWLIHWCRSSANKCRAIHPGHISASAQLAWSPSQVDTTKGPGAGAMPWWKTLKTEWKNLSTVLALGRGFIFIFFSFSDFFFFVIIWYLQMFLFIPT